MLVDSRIKLTERINDVSQIQYNFVISNEAQAINCIAVMNVIKFKLDISNIF
jgi:hypothetical protein